MMDLEDALGNDGSQEKFTRVILSAGRMIPKRAAAERHLAHILMICGYNLNIYLLASIRSLSRVNGEIIE
jgi:hypothetical protein